MKPVFNSERLAIYEINGSSACERQRLARVLPEMLTADVVCQLPPSFGGINNTAKATSWLEEMLCTSRLYSVTLKDGDIVIGLMIASEHLDEQTHIGYLLAHQHWGKGYAGELLGAFIGDYAPKLGWRCLIAGVAMDNIASIKVLEKVGFREEASDLSHSRRYVYSPNYL